MSRFTGSALALLVAFSLVPLSHSEAGERHRVKKNAGFHMIDRSGDRDRRHVRRIVNRNVVVVKVDIDSGRRHRHYRQGDTYSGDVVIDVRNGVGQWSYGSYGADAATVRIEHKAKIIDVGSLKANGACQTQAGVCVIRP